MKRMLFIFILLFGLFQLSLLIAEHPDLLEESNKVCKVLDLICEKSMKSRDTDDVMAMKAHYFATLIRHAKEYSDINAWIKRYDSDIIHNDDH